MNFMEGCKIVDIGTGGGMPGIPIKILRPDVSLLCLDATRKKIYAVEHMVNELQLTNITTQWGRAEEIGRQTAYFHNFDFVIARAVSQLDTLIALSTNFLRQQNSSIIPEILQSNGRFDLHPPALIAFKGGDLNNELQIAIRKYPQADINTINLSFDGSDQLIASDKKIVLVHV
jgi:16S rRNA G527 N7-methylase RsmG